MGKMSAGTWGGPVKYCLGGGGGQKGSLWNAIAEC